MKLDIAAKLLLITYLNIKNISAQTASIEDSYNGGCKNNFGFTADFELDDGSACDSCAFCDKTILADVFNPKVASNCVQCATEQSSCHTFSVITTFQQGWKMNFNMIRSSDKDAKYDPKVVFIRGSNDSKIWEDLHVTKGASDIFTTRNEVKELVLDNNKVYKVYKVSYKMNDGMKLYVGPYGIVEAYARQCATDLYNTITNGTIIPYDTMTPTNHPSNMLSNMPSMTPTVKQSDQPSFFTGKHFESHAQLKTAVDLWISNEQEASKQYGEIQDWKVGKVTSMYQLFYDNNKKFQYFNEDLSRWDVGAVTSMESMFLKASAFNSDISAWNVARVTTFTHMFFLAEAFNSDISNWNVAKVTTMNRMFCNSYAFNSNISDWNVASATDMFAMLRWTTAFEQTLCWGDLSGVITGDMFKYSKGGRVDPNC